MTQERTHRIPLFERLEIESQSNCNRSCWFCPRTYDRSGTYLDKAGEPVISRMPTATILDLLDQAQAMGFQGHVTFFFYSEPLLDRRAPFLAREARRRGMRPFLFTNGDRLRQNPVLCEEIKNVYEFVVVGLYDYRTNREFEEAKRYWQAQLKGIDLKFSTIGPSSAQKAVSMGIPRALVPTDARMTIPDLTYGHAPCHRPLMRMIIRYDGEMCNCCEDVRGAFGLGNIFRESLEDLWFSDRHTQIIESLLAGHREQYDLCRRCPLSPTGPPPDGHKVVMTFRRFEGESNLD